MRPTRPSGRPSVPSPQYAAESLRPPAERGTRDSAALPDIYPLNLTIF
jgi:hypothetical protein